MSILEVAIQNMLGHENVLDGDTTPIKPHIKAWQKQISDRIAFSRFMLSLELPLTHSLVPSLALGSPTATFTRATTAMVQNNDGYLVQALSGEARFQGGRRVHNLIQPAYSENLTIGFTATGSTLAAGSITESGATSVHYAQTTSMVIPTNAVFIMQAEIKQSVGTRNLGIGTNSVGNAIFNPSTGVFVANDGVTLAHGTGTQTADGYWPIWVKVKATTNNKPMISLYSGTAQSYAGDGASQVLVRKYQVEDVTAQTTQTAGEYVSVGVVQRNRLLNSNGLATTSWTTIAATITDRAVVGPDGGYAAKITPSSTGASRGIYQAASLPVLSLSAKAGEFSWMTIFNTGGTTGAAWFDLSNGTLGTVIAGYTATITAEGDGFYRCTLVRDTFANFVFHEIAVTDADNTTTATASGTNGLYIRNMQAEAGTAATAYQETGGTLIYHGSGVDGVKCFPTDLSGNPIPSTTLLGYSAEGARTNLELWSGDLSNAAWTKGAASIFGSTVAGPSGASDGQGIVCTAVNTFHSVVSAAGRTITVGSIVSAGRFFKAGLQSTVAFGIANTASTRFATKKFNLSNGTISAPGSADVTYSVVSSAMVPLANGWWWCTISVQTATDASVVSQVFPNDVVSWTGQGTNPEIYVGGSQLEATSNSSSYIPTTTVAATRNADVLTYTGGDVPNLKTLSATFKRDVGVATTGITVALSDGSVNNFACTYPISSATALTAQGLVGGVAKWNQILTTAITPGTQSKTAFSMAAGSQKFATNGVAQTAATGAAIPTVTQLNVGHVVSGSQLSGNVGGIYGWTRNLSQSELNAITA